MTAPLHPADAVLLPLWDAHEAVTELPARVAVMQSVVLDEQWRLTSGVLFGRPDRHRLALTVLVRALEVFPVDQVRPCEQPLDAPPHHAPGHLLGYMALALTPTGGRLGSLAACPCADPDYVHATLLQLAQMELQDMGGPVAVDEL